MTKKKTDDAINAKPASEAGTKSGHDREGDPDPADGGPTKQTEVKAETDEEIVERIAGNIEKLADLVKEDRERGIDPLDSGVMKGLEEALGSVKDIIGEPIMKAGEDAADQSAREASGALKGVFPRIAEFELSTGGTISVESCRVFAVISNEEPPEPGKPELCRLIMDGGHFTTIIGNGGEVRKDLGHA